MTDNPDPTPHHTDHGGQAEHRPLDVVARDLHQLVGAAQVGDLDRVKDLIEPYFTETDWCCLFELVGGLVAVTTRGMPPVPAGAELGIRAEPGATRAEITWAGIVVAGLDMDLVGARALFRTAIDEGYIGEMMATAVMGAADADKRHKAALS